MVARVDVLGVGVSVVTLPTALDEVQRWFDTGRCEYISVMDVHSLMEAVRDGELQRIHNRSGLTLPDGAPVFWLGRLAGARAIGHVRGADLMAALCERAAHSGWSVYFYGGRDDVASAAAANLTRHYPGLRIAGRYSPPFRALTDTELHAAAARINASGADIVWVGLGAPKQERWMAAMRPLLNATVLAGVGAAFDMHAGTVSQAPKWMRSCGLEWSYRLAREPRRLWRRYLSCIPAFLAALVRHPPRLREWPVADPAPVARLPLAGGQPAAHGGLTGSAPDSLAVKGPAREAPGRGTQGNLSRSA